MAQILISKPYKYQTMASELQSLQCTACKGKFSSTLLKHEVINNCEIRNNSYFKLGEEHYCSCEKNWEVKGAQFYSTAPATDWSKNEIVDYIDQDIYFYDLYITYNNFHQDIPTKKAI